MSQFFNFSVPWKTRPFHLKYFWFSVVALTGVITSITNALIGLAVWKDPYKNLRSSPSSYLIVSQAIADFSVGFIQQPLGAWWLLTFSEDLVDASQVVSSLFLTSSVLHMFVITVDRFVAVMKPTHYSSFLTKRRVKKALLVIWLWSLVYMIFYWLFEVHQYKHKVETQFAAAMHTVVPSFAAVLIYIRLFWALHVYRKSITTLDEGGRLVMNAYTREKKMTKAMVYMLAVFLVCLLPFFVLYQVIDTCPTCEENTVWEMYVFCVTYYLFMSSSLLNPFLYAWRLPKYRSAFRKLLRMNFAVANRVQVA